jgi:bifunctional DNA-binding transcriptional regulator/antitoxin component of YhaV-PrlF toxin-antitoxin module
MPDTLTLQLAQRGRLTLPKALRQAYRLNPGDMLTLLDLGGVFVLTPGRSQVDRLAEQMSQQLAERGETLESMLAALRQARERYHAG